MKKITVLVCCLVLSKLAIAQKDSLALGDQGKYIYYKVVNMDRRSADTLYNRSIRFFEKADRDKEFKLTGRDAKNTTITGTGFFLTYKPSLAKHADGQVSYTIKLEIKAGKYRYWLTDFIYKPYFRDRYNNYVPDRGIEAPLEKPSKAYTDKEQAQYLDQSAMFGRQLGEKLRGFILMEIKPKIKLDTTRRIHIDKAF